MTKKDKDTTGKYNVKNGKQTIPWLPNGVEPKRVIVNENGYIDKCTPEQEALIPIYQQRAADMVRRTGAVDPKVAQHVSDELANPRGYHPKVQMFPSQTAARAFIKEKTGSEPSWADTKGHWEGYWVQFLLFSAYELNLYSSPEEFRTLKALELSALETGSMYIYDTCTVCAERPIELHFDNFQPHPIPRIMHNANGMAIKYIDGTGGYFWHGLQVPEHVIMRPDSITTDMIREEANTEMRRVLMERYGLSRYLRDTGAKPVSEDKYGTLYDMNDAENPYQLVQVTNGSPEPDGTYQEFFLHVRPGHKTPLEAVASTYKVSPDIYSQLAARS